MQLSLQLQHLERPGYSIQLFVPNPQEVQDSYLQCKNEGVEVPFPHWAKLWPAALALSDFLHQHVELVQDKNVVELAAGLGMPSLVAARYAKTVCCSDYLEEAVAVIASSVRHLQLSNVTCRILDWDCLPEELSADVLLLSDINYDPDQFDRLYQVLQRFLDQGTILLLATPQRLMAKPFIEKLLPWCKQSYEMEIEQWKQHTPISILVLQQ